MLTYDTGEPLIRRALMRRLTGETGLKVLGILIKDHGGHITVGVQWQMNDLAIGNSIFDLPGHFELRHAHNEADEIAEQAKEARRRFLLHGAMPAKGSVSETYEAKGTGRRGNWRMYGERTH